MMHLTFPVNPAPTGNSLGRALDTRFLRRTELTGGESTIQFGGRNQY